MGLELALAGLAAGAAKGFIGQKQAEAANKKKAQQNIFTPWTKKSYDYEKEPGIAGALGDMISGGATGASLGQNIDANKANNALTAAKTAAITRAPNSFADALGMTESPSFVSTGDYTGGGGGAPGGGIWGRMMGRGQQ